MKKSCALFFLFAIMAMFVFSTDPADSQVNPRFIADGEMRAQLESPLTCQVQAKSGTWWVKTLPVGEVVVVNADGTILRRYECGNPIRYSGEPNLILLDVATPLPKKNPERVDPIPKEVPPPSVNLSLNFNQEVKGGWNPASGKSPTEKVAEEKPQVPEGYTLVPTDDLRRLLEEKPGWWSKHKHQVMYPVVAATSFVLGHYAWPRTKTHYVYRGGSSTWDPPNGPYATGQGISVWGPSN